MNRDLLYLVTLIVELVLGLFRVLFFGLFFITSLTVAWLFIAAFSNESDWTSWVLGPALILSFLLAYANIIFSVISYLGFGGGGWFTRFVFGARRPSQRESDKVSAVLQEITRGVRFSVPGFSKFWVIDSPMESVNLVGTYLYLSSTAINSENLPVLIAHELGHIKNGDGNVILALRRLVFPLFYVFISGVRDFSTNRPYHMTKVKEFDAVRIFVQMINTIIFFTFALFGGGIGVWMFSWQWAAYFRKQDYRADAYAARLGYRESLLQYLEQNLFYDTAVPYMLGWQPANELRIDMILKQKDDISERIIMTPTKKKQAPSEPLIDLEQIFKYVREMSKDKPEVGADIQTEHGAETTSNETTDAEPDDRIVQETFTEEEVRGLSDELDWLDDAGDSDDEMPDDPDAAMAWMEDFLNSDSDDTPLETMDDKPIEAAEIDAIQEPSSEEDVDSNFPDIDPPDEAAVDAVPEDPIAPAEDKPTHVYSESQLLEDMPHLQTAVQEVDLGLNILAAEDGPEVDMDTLDELDSSSQTLMRKLFEVYRRGSLLLLEDSPVLETLGRARVIVDSDNEVVSNLYIPLAGVGADAQKMVSRYTVYHEGDGGKDSSEISVLKERFLQALVWHEQNEPVLSSERKYSLYGGIVVLEMAWLFD